jgi:hypothetical protein
VADRIVWRERDQFANFSDGGSGVDVQQGRTQILTDIKTARIQALGFAVFTNSGKVVFGFIVSDCKIVMCVYVVWLESDGLFVHRDSTLMIAKLIQ